MKYSKEKRMLFTDKAKSIVDTLSLEEKVSLMSGSMTFEEVRGAIRKLTKEHYNQFPYPAGGIPEKGISPCFFVMVPEELFAEMEKVHAFLFPCFGVQPLIRSWKKR